MGSVLAAIPETVSHAFMKTHAQQQSPVTWCLQSLAQILCRGAHVFAVAKGPGSRRGRMELGRMPGSPPTPSPLALFSKSVPCIVWAGQKVSEVQRTKQRFFFFGSHCIRNHDLFAGVRLDFLGLPRPGRHTRRWCEGRQRCCWWGCPCRCRDFGGSKSSSATKKEKRKKKKA